MTLPRTSKPARKTFHIEWGGSADLTVDEVWPDGDAPDNPIWEDVVAVMSKSRSARGLCQDWSLDIEGIDVDGHDSGLR